MEAPDCKQAYKMGYRFGPRYSYTAYNALPRTYVTRYHLSPRYRYVYRDNYIYVVRSDDLRDHAHPERPLSTGC